MKHFITFDSAIDQFRKDLMIMFTIPTMTASLIFLYDYLAISEELLLFNVMWILSIKGKSLLPLSNVIVHFHLSCAEKT